jgi:GST-like protein
VIDLYTWKTPNGRKVSIMLEETGLPYRVHPVNIGKDEQFDPAFLKIAPNNKIPAIVDHAVDGEPLAVFESGAILLYLAEKTGKFLPTAPVARAKVLEWCFWQMGGLGPMAGQLGFFGVRASEKSALAIDRFVEEVARLLGVLERRLGEATWLGGDDYSIADMLTYPWMRSIEGYTQPVFPEALAFGPATQAWLAKIAARPAVARGMAVPEV